MSACKQQIWQPHGWGTARCSRQAVVGEYCKQHDPLAKAARRAKADREFSERMHRDKVVRTVRSGMHDFWCQIATAILMKRIFQYTAREDYEGWMV